MATDCKAESEKLAERIESASHDTTVEIVRVFAARGGIAYAMHALQPDEFEELCNDISEIVAVSSQNAMVELHKMMLRAQCTCQEKTYN
jgi:hypothetical protein